MKECKVFLKPKKEESLLRFHPWVFSGAIQTIEGEPEEGDLVEVYGTNGRFLAYIIHSGFISGYQNRYGDNLKPPTNVYHRMTA